MNKCLIVALISIAVINVIMITSTNSTNLEATCAPWLGQV